ncbi:unnamed protein product [Chilo suppressalis]|uniref:USP domain-containing protein n=1 Tax=Chilo suppressalis TaxID=168631 RepID=A0ABN8L368_CHISP|nr:unnamed protein product [Chilo suppressalis]
MRLFTVPYSSHAIRIHCFKNQKLFCYFKKSTYSYYTLHFLAHCDCGSKAHCDLSRSNEDYLASFVIHPGSGENCGKVYLRGKAREKVCQEIEACGSVDEYRASVAKKYMKIGGSKPPMLYSQNVLHVAKSAFKKSNFLHEDPITSLDIMKNTNRANSIHDIGKNPFSVEFWTNEQINAYKKVAKKSSVSMCVDATGLNLKSIKRPYSNKECSIFLYVICINSEGCQFLVAQRLAERHTTRDIMNFLYSFHNSGTPPPDELVSDQGRPILNAAVLTYSRYTNIEEYAEKMKDEKVTTRIRIDVAHFENIYKKLFKEVNRRVKCLYMAAIGKLIRTENLREAENIITSIFLMANCETEGKKDNGMETECSRQKNWLIHLVTGYEEDEHTVSLDASNKPFYEDSTEEVHSKLNYWGKWGQKLLDKVSPFFKEEGSDVNAYHLHNVDITKQLLKDLQLIPIWGNILNEKFTFGRNPASSACVEGEINKVKLRMKKHKHPIRVDEYVDESLQYLEGRMLIANSDLDANEKNSLQNDDMVCDVCKNLISFEDASTCTICMNPVHKNVCSEKSRTQNICSQCANTNYVKKNTTLNELENWRGKGEARSKKQRQIAGSKSTTQNKQCIACKDGNFPTGAHKCIRCKKNVHILDGCSISINNQDEGYGEQRLCIDCANIDNRNNNFDNEDTSINSHNIDHTSTNSDCNPPSNDQSDDFNEPQILTSNTKTTRTSKNSRNVMRNKYRPAAKYLGDRTADIKDSLAWDKNRSIPVIKNGNDTSLAPVQLKGKTVTLRNTCAFDSILYLVFAAATDFPHLKLKMVEYDSHFFNMVLDTIEKGLRTHTYTLRVQVLSDIFSLKQSKLTDSMYTIDAYTHPGWLAQQLFKICPSFKEQSTCIYCKHVVDKNLTGLQIQDVMILDRTFCEDYNLNEMFAKSKSICYKCERHDSVEHRLVETGDVIILQVFNCEEKNITIRLDQIPKILKDPLDASNQYLLVGIVNYIGPEGFQTRRHSWENESQTGHYTAFTYRRGNTGWMEFDDLQRQSSNKSLKYKALPRVLMYVKCVK